MKIPIVNENDEVIGLKEKDEIVPTDIYRASAVCITNSHGQMLLAQRSFSKRYEPGHWGPSVAGTLDEGEDYLSNILKEAHEELGLTIDPQKLELGPKLKTVRIDGYAFFCQLYHYVLDKPIEEFVIQKEEVEQIRWYSKEELIPLIDYQEDVFLINIREWLLSLI